MVRLPSGKERLPVPHLLNVQPYLNHISIFCFLPVTSTSKHLLQLLPSSILEKFHGAGKVSIDDSSIFILILGA